MDGTGWTTYGTGGSGTGNFRYPKGISYDHATSYIYVSDNSNDRIVKTQIDGTGWTTYGSNGSGTGKFNRPKGLYYDTISGYLYIADCNNHRVVKTKIDGTGWSALGSLNYPYGIAYNTTTDSVLITDTSNHRIINSQIDGTGFTAYGRRNSTSSSVTSVTDISYDAPSGYYYIVENSKNRVIKLKMDGSGWSVLGSYGTQTYQFNNPSGLDYDASSGYLYIADTSNGRVVRTKMDGTGWSSIGGFNNLLDVAVGENGYVYVSDYDNSRIVKTKIDGTGWAVFGTQGSGPNRFYRPKYIDYSNGYLYVADYGNHRIVKTEFGGTNWQAFGGYTGSSNANEDTAYVAGITYDESSGYIYATINAGAIKTKIDGTGYTKLSSQGSGSGYISNTAGGLVYNTNDNKLYIADTGNSRLTVLNVGDFSALAESSSSGFSKGRLNYPRGFSYDSSTGYFYIADAYNHRIVKTKIDGTGWETFGTYASSSNLIGQFNYPSDVYYDSASEYLYIAESGGSRIVKTKFNGAGWTSYGSNGSGTGNFNNPYGIWYDSGSDYIYVADTSNRRIVKTKIDGTGWTTYGSLGSGVGNFNSPRDVVFDSASGNLYIADTSNYRIVKTQIDGTGWTTYGSAGSGAGNFNSPTGISYDSSTGNIYVVDYGNYRVVRTLIDGSGWSEFGVNHGNAGGYISGSFNNLTGGISYDSSTGTVWVAQGSNTAQSYSQIIGFTMGGGWTSYGSSGSGAGNFSTPSAVYYDQPSGYLYIADKDNERIVKTKIDGTGWTTYGSSGSGVGQFALNTMDGIWYDAATEYIYIADTGNNRIVKTKIDGTGWTTYGSYGTGNGKFSNPRGINYDSASEYLYIADSGNNRIVKTKIDGTGWTTYGSGGAAIDKLSSPYDVKYDPASEYLYIADYGNSRVIKTKIDGTGLTFYGGPGNSSSYNKGVGFLTGITGVDYDAATGYVYATASGTSANRISKFKMDGSYFAALGSDAGSGIDVFSAPNGIAYDSSTGNCYVMDSSNNRVARVNIGGDNWQSIGRGSLDFNRYYGRGFFYDQSADDIFLTNSYPGTISKMKFGSESRTNYFMTSTTGQTKVGQISYPIDVYYDNASGYFYILDGSTSLIKTKADGTGWTTLGSLSSPKSVWYDSVSDYIYVADTSNDRIVKSKIDGTGRVNYGTAGTGIGNFNDPQGVYYDAASEYLYIADTGNNRIVKTKIDGTGWTTYGTTGSGTGNFNSPGRIYYDASSDNIYIADITNNRIVRTKIDGTDWATLNVFDTPNDVQYDSSTGYLYVPLARGNVLKTKWDTYSSYSTTLSASNKVLLQSQGDGMRLEMDPLTSRIVFYPVYNTNKDIYVKSDALNTSGDTWTKIDAYWNQPAGQLKLVVDDTEYVGTGTWDLPSYGDNFYVGSNTAGTETLGGSIDNLRLMDIYEDSDMPTNPTTVHGYSATNKSIELTNDQWYTYTTTGPYFEWSGAADVGSGISGYYVYFGTNGSANPITQGTFQEAATYQNTTNLTTGQTYYLRVSAKDNSNHSAVGTTLFTYKYDVDPPSPPDHVDVNPLGCSTAASYTMSWDEPSGGNSGVMGYEYKNGPDGEVAYITERQAVVSHYQDNGNFFYVRTKNNAGSVSNWQSATYCYATDAGPPTNPTTVEGKNTSGGSVTLTSGNWYNYSSPYFSWNDGTDDTGIAGYYVYFGISAVADPATDGVYQAGKTYTATASSSGQNYYLRIKAKDLAGNAAATTWEAFNYRYSTEAPENPTNLTVLSSQGSSTNLTTATWYNHAHPYFEWSGAGGGQGVQGYYVYFGTTEGADPLNDGVFQVANTYSPTTMNSGSTYYLKIKAKDNAGNPASATWSPFNYKYDGTAPEIPEFISVDPKNCSTTTSFTLSWDAVTDGQSGLAGYDYKKGSSGSVVETDEHSIAVTAYQEGDNIFYARSKDNAGNTSSWQTGVFCSTGTVHVTSGPQAEAGPSSLEVSWVTDKKSTSYVQVYEGNTYISEQGHTSYSTAHSVQTVGLKPEKEYRYKLVWTDENGNLGESEWNTADTAIAPVVKEIRADVTDPRTALVSWQTTYVSTSELQFVDGTREAIKSGTGTDFSQKIDNLEPGKNYQIRIKSISDDGTEFFGQDVIETPPLPTISNLRMESDNKGSSVKIKADWITNTETTQSLFYGLKGESKKEVSSSEKKIEHSLEISGLQDQTEYEIYVSGADKYGNVINSEVRTFTTPIDTRPPQISEITTESSNVGLNKLDKAQIAVSWKTDEPASSYIEYSEGISGDDYSSKTTEDKNYSTSRVIIIPDLDPNRAYHMRVVSTDKAGNVTKSEDVSVVPGEVPRSLLKVLLSTFENVFGWLGNLI